MDINSILTSVKKVLGIEEEYTHFDPDIILHINSVMLSLIQLGVGPSNGFMITGKEETWASLLGDRKDLEAVKIYIYLKVRLLFDPPINSFVAESIERQLSELQWRINNQVEGGIQNGS